MSQTAATAPNNTLPLPSASWSQAGRKSRIDWNEVLWRWGLRVCSYAMVAAVLTIVMDIVIKGAPHLTWQLISEFPRHSGSEGGILPALVGTLCLVGLAIVIALPLGVGSAIYLSEYAKQGCFTELIRLAIVTLAGVPSIVFGLFGLALFVILLGFGTSILSGGLTLACMILPTIIVASEEAIRAVPKALREASLALGATRWQTITTNVLPYALPGILTGTILSIGRAAGETAPILLTVAASFLPVLPTSVYDQVMALPYHLYVLATQHPDAATARAMQYGTALVLLLIVLGMSLIAIVVRNAWRGKIKW